MAAMAAAERRRNDETGHRRAMTGFALADAAV
jgi:hypothetical protein